MNEFNAPPARAARVRRAMTGAVFDPNARYQRSDRTQSQRQSQSLPLRVTAYSADASINVEHQSARERARTRRRGQIRSPSANGNAITDAGPGEARRAEQLMRERQ